MKTAPGTSDVEPRAPVRKHGPDATGDRAFSDFVAALERRHLSELTFAEVRRGLQALSSLYVERRGRIATGAALDGRGKRAAFALYYGPLHFLLVREIVRALGQPARTPQRILDLGCGTGTAGAAWALECRLPAFVEATDTNPWAVAEAGRTLRAFGLRGSARRADAAAFSPPRSQAGVLAAFVVNELEPPARDGLLGALMSAASAGSTVLIVEPLARRMSPWWSRWAEAFEMRGGRADEWRFSPRLPELVERLGRAAGLDPGGISGRSLFVPSAVGRHGARHASRDATPNRA